MTAEEAYSLYRRYLQYANDQRTREINASNSKSACEQSIKRNRSDLSSYNSQKKTAEERLNGVKKVIKFFDNDIDRSIADENSKSTTTGEAYTKAIKCSGIASADIGQAFHTKTVTEDQTMLGSAYQDCVSEKAALERKITELDSSIRQCEESISNLENDIRRYNSVINDAQYYRRKYLNDADYYYDIYRRGGN